MDRLAEGILGNSIPCATAHSNNTVKRSVDVERAHV